MANAPLPPFVGEFFGTLILIVLGNGVVAGANLKKSYAESAGWISITTGWAIAVLSGVCVAAALGDADGHLNPAFTVASVMMTGHAERLWTYIPAQILGAIAGATLVWLHYRPHWQLTEDAAAKRACFCTSPAVSAPFWNLLSEVIGTFVLVLVATALASRRIAPAGVAPGLGPMLVGALVWGVGLSLGGTTGYAINPARDLGPRIAHAILPIPGKTDSGWSYAWIPVLGPVLGAAIAVGAILALKMS
ncbi:MAG: aquaporin family protein [Edaphobacter sp.]|uniref:MIP/aquaporin family protein n=1 Tax=Edaphobacter sp. TaxID=1934404 RepID=UPI0023A786F9|nr:MIP/aquaporin family protein [Edaphobacter sp.]MDE1175779.1 aquaporin family protein [Edaphobacter sp.]